ncbi:MAG TPA: hypothetical protein VF669_13415 [Tepidisphaeraceae bacterium]
MPSRIGFTRHSSRDSLDVTSRAVDTRASRSITMLRNGADPSMA